MLAQVAACAKADVDVAVQHARAAFDDGRWSGLPPMVRDRTMNRLADLIEKHADELAVLEALDNGKPAHVARAERK